MLQSLHRAETATVAVAEAIALLADLEVEIVDRCQASCEICGPLLDAAA